MKTRNYNKFWALLNKLPCASKEELVRSFTRGRTDSLQAMTQAEFQMMVASMEGMVKHMTSPRDADFDLWRKRAMGAIGGWCRARNYPEGKENIFAIALRACGNAGYKTFNDIPLNKLRSIYAEFAGKCRVRGNVAAMERERLQGLYQEAMDGEEYEQAAEYKRQMDLITVN